MGDVPLNGLETRSIDNVYIFLADALRYDELPDKVKSQGLSFKSVAHALTTPQCLPTILSGQLPPKHGVTWFNQSIEEDLHTIFDLEGVHSGYSELVWPGGALRKVLGDPCDEAIDTAEEPFVVFEHDNGGHAPYPQLDADDPAGMLRDMDSREEVLSGYRTSVARSADRFTERLSVLSDRGVLENTLVVLMADHGEILGERGGFFGHQLPMAPEVVYVPTVFVHPSLPSGSVGSHLLHQVDIYPTVLDVLADRRVASDGEPLTAPVAKDRPAYSRTVVHPPAKYRDTLLDPGYDAHGIWTKKGGHVFVNNSKLVRFVMALYEAVLSGHTGAYNSRKSTVGMVRRALSHYLKDYHRYGSPDLPREEANHLIEDLSTEIQEREVSQLTDETKAHLADLGYR